jgi:hypothetical protein
MDNNTDIVRLLLFRQWLFTVLSGLLNVTSLYKVSDIFHLKESTSVLKFDVHVSVHRVEFLIIKPTRCTNYRNLLLE